jgi:hypothetical protein
MDFEKIKKFGVIEVIYENYDEKENDDNNDVKNDDNNDVKNDDNNDVKNDDNNDVNNDDNNDLEDSDNSGNRTGRKIIWYYIIHILSPFKNYRRIKKLIKR